jgi:hypothetical protein
VHAGNGCFSEKLAKGTTQLLSTPMGPRTKNSARVTPDAPEAVAPPLRVRYGFLPGDKRSK